MPTTLCRNPATDGQLTSGDSEGTNSCVSYSYSYSAGAASHCTVHPSGEVIRDWTADHNGGLELDQCDLAMHNHTTLEYDTRVVDYAEFKKRRAMGQGAVVIGGYRPIAASKFSGQRFFHDNHGIWVPPDNKVMDPLADGRHPDTYRYKGEVYPETLIHAFTSALELSDHSLAGPNHVEASFIYVPTVVNPPAIHYKATVTAGLIGFYEDLGSGLVKLESTHHTGGFSAACSSPRIVRFANGKHMRAALLKDGFRKHFYINVGNPRVSVKVTP